MHQVSQPHNPSALFCTPKELSGVEGLNTLGPIDVTKLKQLNDLANYASFNSFGKTAATTCSSNEQQAMLQQAMLQQYLLLQHQAALQASGLFSPSFAKTMDPKVSQYKPDLTALHKPSPTNTPSQKITKRKRPDENDSMNAQQETKKSATCEVIKPVQKEESEASPPKKEFRVKGRVYIVQNERKKWDGRQWRRLCIVDNCSCAARGATLYCVNHGKKIFNVNVKHYRRSNIPSGFECLIKEPKVTKSNAAKAVKQLPLPSLKPTAVLADYANEGTPSDLMQILAQAAMTKLI